MAVGVIPVAHTSPEIGAFVYVMCFRQSWCRAIRVSSEACVVGTLFNLSSVWLSSCPVQMTLSVLTL